jgi:hypothetical protein
MDQNRGSGKMAGAGKMLLGGARIAGGLATAMGTGLLGAFLQQHGMIGTARLIGRKSMEKGAELIEEGWQEFTQDN